MTENEVCAMHEGVVNFIRFQLVQKISVAVGPDFGRNEVGVAVSNHREQGCGTFAVE